MEASLKFQPKSEAEVASAGLFPAGIYDYEVLAATDKTSKSGNSMIELNVEIFDKAGHGKRIFDYLVDSEATHYKVRHFAASAGILAKYEAGNISADDVTGCTGQCKVRVQGEKDGYPPKNAISDYIATKEAAKEVSAKQPNLSDEIPFSSPLAA